MWGASQRALVHRQHKPDPSVFPADIAKTGDFTCDVAPKNIDRHHVTQLQPHLGGLFCGKTDLWWPIIAFRPPFTCGDFGSSGQRVCICDPSVTLHDPMSARDFVSRTTVDLGDDAAQHWGRVNAVHGIICVKSFTETSNLIRLDINEEIAGRYLWQVV